MRRMRPVRPQREALPGLLIIVLIALVGVLLARGLGDLFPEEIFETSPWSGLAAEDIEIDPATGLPIVPTSVNDAVSTWTVAQPNSLIDAGNTWASEAPGGAVEVQDPVVSLLATYPSHEAALQVAEALAGAVGDPAAEAAWLAAAGVDSADGFGWLGPQGSATPFVQVVDRRLLVDGLEWREAYEPPPAEEGEEPGSYGAPLAAALAASATSLLVEGDRDGEGAIAFDLVCIGPEDELLTLGQSLADAPYARPERPPWIEPARTPAEQRSLRTERLVAQLWAASFIQDVMRSDEMERLSRELAQASEAGDEDAMAAVAEAIEAHLAELVPTQLTDLGPLGDAVDPQQMAATMAELTAAETDAAAIADASATSRRDGSASYEVRAADRRLWVTLASWSGVAQGFGPFVGYLDANGCDDIRVVFHDDDDVRVD